MNCRAYFLCAPIVSVALFAESHVSKYSAQQAHQSERERAIASPNENRCRRDARRRRGDGRRLARLERASQRRTVRHRGAASQCGRLVLVVRLRDRRPLDAVQVVDARDN